MAANRNDLLPILTEALITDIEGRLRKVQEVLLEKHIFLLGGGALEHYLPSYEGDRFALSEGAKKKAVAAEVELLATGSIDGVLAERYGELFRCIAMMPAKPPVDTESVLRRYVGSYVHELQGFVVNKPGWGKEQIVGHFGSSSAGLGNLIQLLEFERLPLNQFSAVLKITGPQGLLVDVSHETNAGMQQFTFRSENKVARASGDHLNPYPAALK